MGSPKLRLALQEAQVSSNNLAGPRLQGAEQERRERSVSRRATSSEFDPAKAKAFAGKLVTAMNHGALCLMISVGHRTGLFDAMSGLAPSTSEEIARAAGLNERYVREWLAAMVTGRVVEFDAARGRYFLPAEHAASLTRAAGAENMASFTQYFAELGRVEDEIVGCFRKGGGVPYSRYPRFQEVMMEDSGQSVAAKLESHILPLAPGLAEALERGIRVLDVGCGRGLVMMRLAELFPRSRFTGMDLSEKSIELARGEAARRGLGNAEFVAADACDFLGTAEPESCDFITAFDAIHDQAKPLDVLRGIQRALKPDGVFLMQDISGTSHLEQDVKHPLGTLLYTVSCLHCMTVSLAQGGEGLGAMWGEEKTREYLGKAGFGRIETRRLEHDVQNNWYVVRK
jgi:ubiquinone/menaquinone biosynthesis C-methylase UbiE